MKHTLINICLCTALFVCGGCSSEYEIEDGGIKETGSHPASLRIHATASNFENLPVANSKNLPATGYRTPSTRTPVEDGLNTKFQTGDAIGIFAVKDIGTSGGVIVDAINNTQMTYNEATKSWNPPAGTSLYWYAGVSYVAYYPYKAGITIDVTKSESDIFAALAANSSFRPTTDQATAAKYTACDLMTASGTPTVDPNDPARQILDLTFTHQFALLVLEPLLFAECIAPTGVSWVYHKDAKATIIDPKVQDVTLNGITPCKMADGSYRAIVLPNTNATPIAGNYKTSNNKVVPTNKMILYSGNATAFVAGGCHTLQVNNPFPDKRERPLAPGDFVYRGTGSIKIYPGDWFLTNGKIPDYINAIGMVVTCAADRMTDAKCNAKGWNHAYAIGLENVGTTGTWCDVDSYKDESVLPNLLPSTGAGNNMNGYTETEAMLTERATKGDIDKYGAFKKITTYRSSNPVPEGVNRSPWFIPSVGQWFDFIANIGGQSPDTFDTVNDSGWGSGIAAEIWSKIKNQFDKVGKPLNDGQNTFFFSSSEAKNETESWTFVTTGDSGVFLLLSGNKTADYFLLRPFFAF